MGLLLFPACAVGERPILEGGGQVADGGSGVAPNEGLPGSPSTGAGDDGADQGDGAVAAAGAPPDTIGAAVSLPDRRRWATPRRS